MKRTSAAIAVVAAGLAVAASAEETAGWTPELTFKVKRVGTVRVSPDGSRAAFVVGAAVMEGEKSEWVSQIHVAGADGTGAFQLTRSEKSSTAPAWSPDGSWIAFVAARGARTPSPTCGAYGWMEARPKPLRTRKARSALPRGHRTAGGSRS
jgi:dipeptidyl aminopeptidase/acylaminoacyl peptidase